MEKNGGGDAWGRARTRWRCVRSSALRKNPGCVRVSLGQQKKKKSITEFLSCKRASKHGVNKHSSKYIEFLAPTQLKYDKMYKTRKNYLLTGGSIPKSTLYRQRRKWKVTIYQSLHFGRLIWKNLWSCLLLFLACNEGGNVSAK